MNRILLILISLVMLTLATGFVSAEDNITFNETVNPELIDDYEYETEIPQTVSKNWPYTVGVYNMPSDADGNISISIDDKEKYNKKVSPGGNFLVINDLNLKDGFHTALINYTGDNKYKGFVEKGVFEKTFLKVTVNNELTDTEYAPAILIIDIDEDVTGNIKALIDNKVVLNEKCDGEPSKVVHVKSLSFGAHTYEVIYSGGNQKSLTKKGNFNFTYYFNVNCDNYNISIGDKVEFSIISFDGGEYEVNFNNKTFKSKNESYSWSDFKLGENIFKFTRLYKSVKKTEVVKINVNPILTVPEEIFYHNNENITFCVSKYTKGNLTVKIDNELYNSFIINGENVFISLNNLSVGKHLINITYTGDDSDLIKKSDYTINVIPYLSNKLWINGLNNVIFKTSPSLNGNLILSGYVNKNVTLTNGTAVFDLPDMGAGQFKLNVSFENTTWSYNLTVFKDNPVLDMKLYYPSKIHPYESIGNIEYQIFIFSILNIPEGISGELNIYHDGKYIGNYYDDMEITPLFSKKGNHTISVKYSGDDFFKPAEKSVTYTITDIMDYNLNNKDLCILLPYNATGSLLIKVNGKNYKSLKLKDDGEYSGVKQILISLESLKFNTPYDIELNYNGNFGKIIQKQKITLHYNISISELYTYFYGEENLMEFIMPEDTKNKAVITIDGKSYNYKRSYDVCTIDISNLKPGIHNIKITYPGDNKYYSNTVNKTFEVFAKITPPYWQNEYKSTVEVSVTLPKDATGKLNVEINGKFYKSQVLKDGKASILMPSNSIGEYNYTVYYEGNYNITPVKDSISITPKWQTSGKLKYGENISQTIQIDNETRGKLILFAQEIPIAEFDIENENTTINIDKKLLDNAKTIIKALTSSWMYSKSSFFLELKSVFYVNNTKIDEKTIYISYKSKIEADNIVVNYNDGKIYKIKVYDIFGEPLGEGEKITVKIAGTTYNLKTNSKGTVSFKIQSSPNKYNVKISYDDLQITKKITVKHILTLNKVKVKKSAKRLILTAKLSKNFKNKKIIFKFGGKKFIAKTNKKGFAKVIIKKSILKKLKAGKTVKYQASYLKDTVRRVARILK